MFTRRRLRLIAVCILFFCLCWNSACKKGSSGAGQASDEAFGAFVKPDVEDTVELWEGAVDEPAPASRLNATLEEDQRIAFFNFDTPAALGGAITAGDHIDIAMTVEVAKKPGWVNTLVLQHVAVRLAETADDAGWTLGLVLTEEEASVLRVAQRRGQLHAMLRGVGDAEVSPVRHRALRAALSDLEVINRRRLNRQAASQLDPDRLEASTLSQRIAEGRRAVAVPTDLPAAVLSEIRAGDRVDISGSFPIDDKDQTGMPGSDATNFAYVTMLHNVDVLGVRADEALIVELSVEEAQVVWVAASRGQIDVMLRGADDRDMGGIRRMTSADLLEELELIPEPRKTRTVKRRARPRVSKSSTPTQAEKKNADDYAARLGGSPSLSGFGGRRASNVGGAGLRPAATKPRQQGPSPDKASSDKPERSPRFVAAPASGIVEAEAAPRSTFSFDVDTSSYTVARRYLREDKLPPSELVRVEEFVNYFDYSLSPPEDAPFAVSVESAPNPFRRSENHYLVALGVRAGHGDGLGRKPVNLTLLVDTSSSMRGGDRIGFVQNAVAELTSHLRPDDTVAIVGYGDGVHQLIGRVSGDERNRMIRAVRAIEPKGMSAMQAGVERAYWMADAGFEAGAENRVIILSDGDPNIGAETHQEILKTVKEERARGITLSTVGFGGGDYGDHLMEQMADNGDGNNHYVDSNAEAKRLFGERILPTLVVVARDVKAQVEFDPAAVVRYRRVGYDNRVLSEADFLDSEADAAEIGAGQRVTVLYEVELAAGASAKNLGTARVRFKSPDNSESMEISAALERSALGQRFSKASDDFRFQASLMGFAEVLGQTPLGGRLSLESIRKAAEDAAGDDASRREVAALIERALVLLE